MHSVLCTASSHHPSTCIWLCYIHKERIKEQQCLCLCYSQAGVLWGQNIPSILSGISMFHRKTCWFSALLLPNMNLDHLGLCEVDPLCFPANRGSCRSPTGLFCIEKCWREKIINISVRSDFYRSKPEALTEFLTACTRTNIQFVTFQTSANSCLYSERTTLNLLRTRLGLGLFFFSG